MKDEDIKALVTWAKLALQDVPPGPWYVEGVHWEGMDWADYEVRSASGQYARGRICSTRYGNDSGRELAQFIAATRFLVPALIEAVEALLPKQP